MGQSSNVRFKWGNKIRRRVGVIKLTFNGSLEILLGIQKIWVPLGTRGSEVLGK